MAGLFKTKQAVESGNYSMKFTAAHRENPWASGGQQASYTEVSSKKSGLKQLVREGSPNSKAGCESGVGRASSTDLFKVCIQQLKKEAAEPSEAQMETLEQHPQPSPAYVLSSSKVVTASLRDYDPTMVFKANIENHFPISVTLPRKVIVISSDALDHQSSHLKKHASTTKFLRSFDLGNPEKSESPHRINRKSLHHIGTASRKGSLPINSSEKSLGSAKYMDLAHSKSKKTLVEHFNGSSLFGASLFDKHETRISKNPIAKNVLSREENSKSFLKLRKSVGLVDYSNRDRQKEFQQSNKTRFDSGFAFNVDPVDRALFGDRKSCSSLITTNKRLIADQGAEHPEMHSQVGNHKLETLDKTNAIPMLINKEKGGSNYRSAEFLPSTDTFVASRIEIGQSHQSAYVRLSSKVSQICKDSSHFGAQRQSKDRVSFMGSSQSRLAFSSAKPEALNGLPKKVPTKAVFAQVLPVKGLKQTVINSHAKMVAPASKGPGSWIGKYSNSQSGISTPNTAKANIKRSIEPKSKAASQLHTKNTSKPLKGECWSAKTGLNTFFKKTAAQPPSVPKYKHKTTKSPTSKPSKSPAAPQQVQVPATKLCMVSVGQTKFGNSSLMSQSITAEEANLIKSNCRISKIEEKMIHQSQHVSNILGQVGMLAVPISREADLLGENTEKSRSKLSLKSRSDVGLKLPEPASLQKLKFVGSQNPEIRNTGKNIRDSKKTIRSKLEEYSHQPYASQILKRSNTDILEQSCGAAAPNKPDIFIKRPSERSLGSVGSGNGRIGFQAQNSLQIDHQIDSPKSVPNAIKSVGKLSLSKFYNRADSYSLVPSIGLSDSKSLKREFKKQMQEELQDDTSMASKGLILGKILGRGRFGIVRLIVDPAKQNKALVLKCYNKLTLVSANALSSVENEVKVLKLLNHPNIIKLEEYRESSQSVAVIMEYGGQRNFAEYIQHYRSLAKSKHKRMVELRVGGGSKQRLHIPHLLEIYIQVLRGVEYLHSQDVGHRDLKLENIVLMEADEGVQTLTTTDPAVREDSRSQPFLVQVVNASPNNSTLRLDGSGQRRTSSVSRLEVVSDQPESCQGRLRVPRVKIIDFGFAIHTTGLSDLRCGTPAYMSPELVQKQKYRPSKVDIWALGVILFKIIFNSVPFHATSLSDLYHRIVTQDLVFPSSTHSACPMCKPMLPAVKELVERMLQKDPSARPTVQEVRQHPLFASLPVHDKRHLVSGSQSVAGEDDSPEDGEEEDPSIPMEVDDLDFERLQESSLSEEFRD